jgi:hypothetical protein
MQGNKNNFVGYQSDRGGNEESKSYTIFEAQTERQKGVGYPEKQQPWQRAPSFWWLHDRKARHPGIDKYSRRRLPAVDPRQNEYVPLKFETFRPSKVEAYKEGVECPQKSSNKERARSG